ncbi:MAG: HEAT repeat domain-containing protein [Polyangia bacterium]
MRDRPPSPSLLAVAVTAAVLLLIGLLLWRGRGREGAVPSGELAASGERSGAGTASGAGAAAPRTVVGANDPLPIEEVLPAPSCLPGLADFDQRATLEDLRAAIAAAGGADEALQTYLSERLAELIGADPARAQAVLGWVEKASPQAAAMYLAAIKQSEAAHHASVPPKLLSLAEQAGAPSELRAAALSALETQRRLDDSAMQRLRRIALDESSEQTAWLATRTLGRVLTEDFQRTGESGRYIKTLLDISGRSADTGVRSLALEMPSYGQPLLPGDTIDELGRLLRRDPDRAVREMAALRLSLTEAPQRALKVYEEAFPAEQDLCVRWAMFRFALRAGGAQALPLLAKMAAIEPRLKRDYDEFQALYQKGVVDFERIWQGKAEHIQCMEEG